MQYRKVYRSTFLGICADMTDYREPLTDDEAEQIERGLRRFLNTPPQPHGKNPSIPPPKTKTRQPSKGRVHKAKSRS